MYFSVNFVVSFMYFLTAQACFKDRVSPVTIQNYEGPIYVSPCNEKCDNRCSQLYHFSSNPACDCDCSCVTKNIPPVLCPQPCSTPLVPCGQPCCNTPQVPYAQPSCVMGTQASNGYTSANMQGCVSYLQTWQGSGSPGYYQSCPDCNGWHYKGNEWGSSPVTKCANQMCQCGMMRSGCY
ncbi:hypothetical protein O3G_MSEX011165 [Manduca sexta]|uniref:Uncharacterized protein n=1 Tax=Manduca sexta TaxID=7130 RepID=A0A922CUP2_MANSE|nr:hypothetical protein O3G_MSEX011165 [Manduca sexta]